MNGRHVVQVSRMRCSALMIMSLREGSSTVIITVSLYYTVNDIRIYPRIFCGDRVFHILTESIPYTFVSVYRRNNEVWAIIAMWANASLFRRFTDTNVYGIGSVKIWKTRSPQNIRGYIRISFTV